MTSRIGLLPAHPVSAARHLPQAAVAHVAAARAARFDLLGFQTLRDRRNFVQCLRALVKDTEVDGQRPGAARLGARAACVRVGNFPISIDYDTFMRQAATRRGRGARARAAPPAAQPQDHPRHRPARLHQGHSAAAAGLPPPARRATPSCARRCRSSRSWCRAARTSREYHDAQDRHRAARRQDQRRASCAPAAGCPCGTSTAACRGSTCSPTTARPTSRSSPRSRTA